MTTIQDALDYLRMGLSVIPLNPRDKKPAISSWAEFQTRLPTEKEINAWFSDENKNIGIICGKVSGDLVVIDFDSNETFPFVISDINSIAKETMVVRTGKGFHLYYRYPGVATFKLQNLKIDVKAEGGYVVAPPSLHPSGVQYERIGTLTIKNSEEKLFAYLRELEAIYPIAKLIAEKWEPGKHHELSLRIGAFFNSRAKWPEEKTVELLKGVMRLKGDFNELNDRVRAVRDAYQNDYSYNGLPAELIENIVRLLPKGTGEIWSYYDKGSPDETYWKAYICRDNGLFRVTHKVDDEGEEIQDETKIFSQPLILADAWHSEGDEVNRVKFTFFLGDVKYQGTKKDVSDLIIESGLTGIVPTSIKLAVAACVEYYMSSKMVKVRESYEAIGVYSKNGGFEIALGDKDISAMRGTEPWYVFRRFKPYQGAIEKDAAIFNRLWEFFDSDYLALLYGMSAVAPFSYALKGEGNFFWPLFIMKGPRATGKTTLGELFTTYLYGVYEGGPADVTSDYRLLDFVTGTTFPRLIDESENAKFEGQKFSMKISTTLKDAAEKQIVGNRGNIDKTKKLYSARTPLILAGNKIDLEDPALMTRSIFMNFDITSTKSNVERRIFSTEILRAISRGFGLNLVDFIANKMGSVKRFVDEIKNRQIEYQFTDPRREDFYASIYTGLELWDEFYRSIGISFALSGYLSEERFLRLVKKFEESNSEESQERQSVLILIDWVKTRVGIMENIGRGVDHVPALYYELEQMFKRAIVNGKEWFFVTQTALSEFKRSVPSFQEVTLSEAADALSKYYGVSKEKFYNRKTEFIGNHSARVLRIPVDGVGLNDYGGVVEGDSKDPPPLEKLNQLNQHSTSGGVVNGNSGIADEHENSTTLSEKMHSQDFLSKEKIILKNSMNSGVVVEKLPQDNIGLNKSTTPLSQPNSTSGVVPFRIERSFFDGLMYSEGQIYNWDPKRAFVQRLIKSGKIKAVDVPPLTIEEMKNNLERKFREAQP